MAFFPIEIVSYSVKANQKEEKQTKEEHVFEAE